MNDEIREILDSIKEQSEEENWIQLSLEFIQPLLDYITNLQKENERLNIEVAKLHIIQEEYGNHIENTHIIDDYQKTYFMSNKWLIELKDGRFVDINVLNSDYEDYKSRVKKAVEYINKNKKVVSKYEAKDTRLPLDTFMWGVDNLLNILQGENNE